MFLSGAPSRLRHGYGGQERALSYERRLRILFTEVFLNLLVGDPLNRPAARPAPRIGSRIVNRDVVSQRVQVRTGEPLHEVQRLGVRQTAISQPEALVEADRIDDERVLFPPADRAAVVTGNGFGRLPLRPAVGVDDAPVAVAPA